MGTERYVELAITSSMDKNHEPLKWPSSFHAFWLPLFNQKVGKRRNVFYCALAWLRNRVNLFLKNFNRIGSSWLKILNVFNQPSVHFLGSYILRSGWSYDLCLHWPAPTGSANWTVHATPQPGVNVIKLFSLLPTHRGNKLECLYALSFLRVMCVPLWHEGSGTNVIFVIKIKKSFLV
jgi:hypothetical protein